MMQPAAVLLAYGMLAIVGVAQCGEVALDAAPKDLKLSEASSVGFGASSWNHQPALTVQTGYEGLLVPLESLSIRDVIKTSGIFAVIPIIGQMAGRVAVRSLMVLASLTVVFLLSVLVTSGLCRYTNLCYFSLYQHWDRSSVGSLVSQDKIESAARFLATAVNKFGQMKEKNSV